MNNKILAFTGRLGSGKDYMAQQHISKLKDDGNSIYMVSFADPIKQILYDCFKLTKSRTSSAKPVMVTQGACISLICTHLTDLINQIDESITFKDVHDNYIKYEDEFYGHVVDCIESGEDEMTKYNFAFRRLGQLLGTELGRYVYDTIWIDLAYIKIKKAFEVKLATYAIIADVRFINEYDSLIEFTRRTGITTKCYGVVASDETRAKRRKMTIEELKAQDNHGSEREVGDIIDMLPKDQVINND